MTSERLRTLRRTVIYALFGVVAYAVALTFCFPYDRAREMAIAAAAKGGYDLEIGAAGPSFPFGILFEDLRLRTRTVAYGTKPTQARFDSARVALLTLFLSRGKAFDLSLVGLGGTIELSGRAEKKGPLHVDVRVRGVSMGQLPGAREQLNLPLGGTLDLTFRLDSTTGNFADAKGELGFKCAACTVGDGKTPIKVSGGNAFLAAGLTLPRVRLGDFVGRAVIDKGVAKLQGVEAKSADAELTVEGDVALRDPLPYSNVNIYVRFKLGDALLKASPTIGSVLQMAASPGIRPDGFYGMRLTGSASAMASVFSPTSQVVGGGTVAGRAARPAVMPVLTPPSQRAAPPPPPPPPPPAPTIAAPPPPPPPPPPAVVVPPPPPAPPAPEPAPPAPAPSTTFQVPPMRGTPPAGGIMAAPRGGAGSSGAAIPGGAATPGGAGAAGTAGVPAQGPAPATPPGPATPPAPAPAPGADAAGTGGAAHEPADDVVQ